LRPVRQSPGIAETIYIEEGKVKQGGQKYRSRSLNKNSNLKKNTPFMIHVVTHSAFVELRVFEIVCQKLYSVCLL